MLSRIYPLKRYILSAVFVTSLASLPVGSGSVFTQGTAPEVRKNDNHATVNEAADKKEASTSLNKSALILSGHSGQVVTTLQSALNDHGFNLHVDGIFGSNTDRVVRKFQQGNGIAVDGIVGPETKEALNSTSQTDLNRSIRSTK